MVVLGTDEFDAAEIDANSIRLAGVAPLRAVFSDDATAIDASDDSGSDEVCNTDMPDGYTDLVLKFDTEEIVAALGDVQDGDVVTLELVGSMQDGTELEGEDIVTIIAKGKDGTDENNGRSKGGKKK